MNKKVKITTFTLMCTIFVTWNKPTLGWRYPLSAFYTGAIQFPQTIKKAPSIRVYFSGTKTTCNTQSTTYSNHKDQSTTFSINPIDRKGPLFFLVTEGIQWDAEENTIHHLKIDSKRDYKLFSLQPNASSSSWSIEEISLNDEGIIPDNTIIVMLNPDWIQEIKGGNSITLPTLFIKNSILEQLGSEQELHDYSEALFLSAIDYDSIHSPVNRIIKRQNNVKKVLALTT